MNSLLPTSVHDFDQAGVFAVPQLFDDFECDQMRREASVLASSTLISPRNLRTETWLRLGERVLSKFDPVADVSGLFAEVASDSRVVRYAQEALGATPTLFKDKLVCKLPGHPGFGPHQDNTWYRPFTERLVGMMIALDSCNYDTGALEVALGKSLDRNAVPLGQIRDLRPDEC
ncbi:MAG: phytanoyl-CoA dioxygenase family protein, partial [Pseudomonadota bacterium]